MHGPIVFGQSSSEARLAAERANGGLIMDQALEVLDSPNPMSERLKPGLAAIRSKFYPEFAGSGRSTDTRRADQNR